MSFASTAGWRACAVSGLSSPIGIDIERPVAFPETGAMLERAGEGEAFRAAAEGLGWSPAVRLARLWTAKEAVLKAAGVGLSVDPREVAFEGVTDRGLIARACDAPWCVRWWTDAEVVVAIATDGPAGGAPTRAS